MRERPPVVAQVVVLSNAVVVRSNPWLGSWLAASRAAGVDVRDLDLPGVLAAGGPAGAHLQWPEQVLNPASRRAALRRLARLLMLCAVLRLRGRRVLLTVHNTRSHDARHPHLERVLWAALGRLVTDVHVMSLAGRPEVLAQHPRLAGKRWHVIPHGDYAAELGALPDAGASRAAVRVTGGGPLLMTVGALRAYKGARDLLHAFSTLDDPSATLLMAGRAPDAEEAAELHRVAAGDPRVRLTTELVAPDELHRALAAADLVVLPYRAVLNSGSAFLALSAGRRVLVPRTPTFEELSRRVGDGWVHVYDGPLTATHLARAVGASAPTGRPDLAWCSWTEIERAIGDLWGEAS